MPSLAPRPMSDDLSVLVSALVDGTISTEDLARLEERLRTERTARDAFRDFMQMESILAWELVHPAAHDGEAQRSEGGSDERAPQASGGWQRAAAWLVPLLAAAATAAAVTLIPMLRQADNDAGGSGPKQHARLVDATGAEWAGSARIKVGDGIADGPLRLVAGSAQLRFESGAVVTLNAPSEIEVLGDNRLFLRNGSIIPFVPPAAKGFTVVSPTGEVIDLGTEFSVSVDARGQTDVYVIDGEVDVAKGHADQGNLVRMTQGFGTRLAPSAGAPTLTQAPFVIDDFDDEPSLRWHDVDAGRTSSVAAGELSMPVEYRPDVPDGKGWTRLVLDHDFSTLRGRRSAISFKASLPTDSLSEINRWLACVVDDGAGDPPMAYDPQAALAVLISPDFQAGVRIDGAAVRQTRVFSRSEDAIGPYQVFITIDDTPAAWRRYGSAVASAAVNGQELMGPRPITLAKHPRIGLQTFCAETSRGRGRALVDDFSVSVSADGEGRADTIPPTVLTPFVDGDRVVVAGHGDGTAGEFMDLLHAFYRSRFPARGISFTTVTLPATRTTSGSERAREILALQPTVVMLGVDEDNDHIDGEHAQSANDLIRELRDGDVKRIIVLGGGDFSGEMGDQCLPVLDAEPLLVAAAVLRAQRLEGKVAESVINASTQSLEKSENCSITKIHRSGELLDWTYLANALPFPMAAPGYATWQAARVAGAPSASRLAFDHDFNTERLVVLGLPAGRYALAIDEVEIGEFSAEVLRRGINLARIPTTPQNLQAVNGQGSLPVERHFTLRPRG
jgi:ferric-dicitrate binding protein FerR (iron transport regulator)